MMLTDHTDGSQIPSTQPRLRQIPKVSRPQIIKLQDKHYHYNTNNIKIQMNASGGSHKESIRSALASS
jgi:hypothetical protein